MRRYLPLLAILLWSACSNPQQDAQKFLDQYTKTYVERYTASSQAAWKTNIEIKEGDTVNAYNSRVADEALASFTGSVANIEQAQKFLAQKGTLTPLQIRQLEIIL